MKTAVIILGVLVATAFAAPSDIVPKNDDASVAPTSDGSESVETVDETPKMPSMEDMMKNMKPGAMGNMMNDMMKNVDMDAIGNIMQNMDMGAIQNIMQNVDMGAIQNMMQNMDMGAMNDIMKNMDMGAMGDIMKNMDMGAIGNMMKNVDMGMIGDMMKNVDIGAMMQNMGPMMKNMGPMMDMMKNVDMKGIMGMAGLPKDASPTDILGTISGKVQEAVANPMETLQWAKEKLKDLKLPEGMEIADLLKMAHGQLEALGVPAEPEKIKEMLGLEGVNMEDLKDPKAIKELLRKQAFHMLGLDENEDPMVIKKRIEEQLLEEANKMGANLSHDSTPEQIKAELDKTMSQELKHMGLEVDSVTPAGLKGALQKALTGMGLPFPIHDLGSLKSHVMKMVMNKLMSKVTPMIINLFMPHPHHERSPMMPPHMMRPMRSSMMPLDLDIEINIDQSMPVPGYLRGAEAALDHPIESFESDERVFHHIMAVREALRTGEMPDGALEEMIEDLMNARLKARVLSVKNMFLNDRLRAMEQKMDMMGPMRMPVPRTSSISDSPIFRVLKGMRD